MLRVWTTKVLSAARKAVFTNYNAYHACRGCFPHGSLSNGLLFGALRHSPGAFSGCIFVPVSSQGLDMLSLPFPGWPDQRLTSVCSARVVRSVVHKYLLKFVEVRSRAICIPDSSYQAKHGSVKSLTVSPHVTCQSAQITASASTTKPRATDLSRYP